MGLYEEIEADDDPVMYKAEGLDSFNGDLSAEGDFASVDDLAERLSEYQNWHIGIPGDKNQLVSVWFWKLKSVLGPVQLNQDNAGAEQRKSWKGGGTRVDSR